MNTVRTVLYNYVLCNIAPVRTVRKGTRYAITVQTNLKIHFYCMAEKQILVTFIFIGPSKTHNL